MENYLITNRSFQCAETKHICSLYVHSESKDYKLIYNDLEAFAEHTEVNGFYICAHTATHIKINNSKIVFLERGQFYHLKLGEKVTHNKYLGFKNYKKV